MRLRRVAIDRPPPRRVVMTLTKTKGDTMSEFIGTTLLVISIAAAAYWLGKSSNKGEIRFWRQRAISARKIADDMGRAAMDNYIDLAVAELRQVK